jgi:hypothetical protein
MKKKILIGSLLLIILVLVVGSNLYSQATNWSLIGKWETSNGNQLYFLGQGYFEFYWADENETYEGFFLILNGEISLGFGDGSSATGYVVDATTIKIGNLTYEFIGY